MARIPSFLWLTAYHPFSTLAGVLTAPLSFQPNQANAVVFVF